MSVALAIALVLVFVMGIGVQRGNTCTVVAFDDLFHRHSPERLLAIAYCWLWVAGGLTLLKLTTGLALGAQLFPITVWSVIGGLILGFGAVVNGACTVGTVARIGSGEYAYGLTLVRHQSHRTGRDHYLRGLSGPRPVRSRGGSCTYRPATRHP